MTTSNQIDWTDMSSFTVSRGYTYSYKYLPSPSRPAALVILFFHGFPTGPRDWDALASSLHSKGYACLIPSCLGYLESSTPEDPEAYNSESLCKDIAEVLDHESIRSIIALGHDWGSFIAQRMAIWYPERTKGLVTLCVQFFGPEMLSLPLDDWIAKCKEEYEVDYDNYTYMRFYSSDESQELMNSNPHMVFSLFAANRNKLPELMLKKDVFRDWWRAGIPFPVPDTPEMAVAEKTFTAKWSRNKWTAPLNCYKALGRGIHWAHECDLPASRYILTQPALFVGASRDGFCPPSGAEKQRKYLRNLKIIELDAGHGVIAEQAVKLESELTTFLEANGW